MSGIALHRDPIVPILTARRAYWVTLRCDHRGFIATDTIPAPGLAVICRQCRGDGARQQPVTMIVQVQSA